MPTNETNHQNKYSLSPISYFLSGAIAGTICASIFHPWDRAMFLSVKHNRSFFDKSNFKNIFHGLDQTIIHRGFFGSGYFIAQAGMKASIVPYMNNELGLSKESQHFCV